MTAAAPRRRALGLRREVAVLVPASLLLLIALSAYTLLSYRSAVGLLLDAHRSDALRTARALAAEAAVASPGGAGPTLARLRRAAPGVAALALLDDDGVVVAASGELASLPLAPFAPPDVPAATLRATVGGGVAGGPDPTLPDAVAALAPLAVGGERRYLRVELPAVLLASRRRELGVLTVLVVGIDLAVGLLLLFFVRHLMAPYDAMLATARRLEADGDGEAEDDIELLVRTFERGIAALAGHADDEPRSAAGDADLAALERTLAASLESGLLLLDGAGKVVSLNPVGAELLALAPPPPGTPVERALAARPPLGELLAAAVASGGGIQRREVEVDLGGSSPRTLGLTVHPLRRAPREGGGAPRLRGFLVLFADLTEARRQAEESRLADSLVRLGELAAGVAHELRNSLATLRGYLTLLERSPDEARELLAELRHESDHLERVLDDFLSFARPGSVRLEDVRLGVLVARAAADPALEGVAVRVEDNGLGGTVLRGDPQLLERALRNLLHNAREAVSEAGRGSGDGPAVEVRLTAAADEVEIAVGDRGPGVPPELRDRLFHPFASGRPGGVGLGLSLAHRIVSLHHGSLRLEDRPGGGTVAVVRLPIGRVVTMGSETEEGAEPGGNPPLPPDVVDRQ